MNVFIYLVNVAKYLRNVVFLSVNVNLAVGEVGFVSCLIDLCCIY